MSVTHVTETLSTVPLRRPRRSFPVGLRPVVGFLAFVAFYGIAHTAGLLPAGSTPSVVELGATIWNDTVSGVLVSATGATLLAWLVGLAIAVVIGVPLGIAVGLSRWVEAITGPTIEFLRPIPAVSLVPVAILVFGLKIEMQAFLIVVASVWPIMIATRHAVRNIDPLWKDTARVNGQGPLRTIIRVVLPGSVPGIATGLRTAASLALVVAVAAEIISGSAGLGQYLNAARSAGDAAATFAGVVVAGVVGVVIDAILRVAERLVSHWQVASTEGRSS